MVERQEEVINVVVLGPEQAGKSSLVGRFIAKYSNYWTPEKIIEIKSKL